jgi:hypothetical protein
MALYPKAVPRLINPGSNDPAIEVVGAILHVDAGNASSLYEYFRDRSGGIESHFHIRRDGVVEQYRNTGWEADANLNANSFWSDGRRNGYVSIETQGYGTGQWTPEQLESIKALLLWLSQTHGFPLRLCTSPYGGGVGFHTLFGAPSAWTPVAKSCPGPDRIKQFRDVLVPWFAEASKPASEPLPLPEIRRRLRKRMHAAKSAERKAWLLRVIRLIRRGPKEG